MPIDINEFKENLNLCKIPTILEKIIEFQNQYGAENYAGQFYIEINEKWGLKTWSEHSDFLDKLYPFANADGTGSIFAIWNYLPHLPLEENPVIFFGDEGDVKIVALNLQELITYITFDWDQEGFDLDKGWVKKEKPYMSSPYFHEFLELIETNFNISPLTDEESALALEQKAQKKYGEAWKQFFEQHVQSNS